MGFIVIHCKKIEEKEEMFSLFAPTTAEACLIGSFAERQDVKMDRQADGKFLCSPSVSDGKYEYKYRVRHNQGDWFGVIDPCATVYHPQ